MEEKEILLGLAMRLKYLRKGKAVTQEDVYNETGIHIARIEQGKRDISYSTLIKLSRYFGVTLDYFDESQLKITVSESKQEKTNKKD